MNDLLVGTRMIESKNGLETSMVICAQLWLHDHFSSFSESFDSTFSTSLEIGYGLIIESVNDSVELGLKTIVGC
jgi:hypothetical protein